jgi:hypothetical protein
MNLQHNFNTFFNKFIHFDPEFLYVSVAFLIACMFWAYPIFFSRYDVLGKLVMVTGIIAMTMYHRIAGIFALVAVIALLNRTPVHKVEGLTMPSVDSSADSADSSADSSSADDSADSSVDSSADSSSFANPLMKTTSPVPKNANDFRKMHCMTGVKDAAKFGEMPDYGYMLKPDLFTDASGNPTMSMKGIQAVMLVDQDSLKKCTPVSTVPNTPGYNFYSTIQNICDPKCDWSIAPTPTPTPTATANPTTAPDNSEGFSTMAMLRPHIRNGKRLLSDGAENVKGAVNRLQRKLF